MLGLELFGWASVSIIAFLVSVFIILFFVLSKSPTKNPLDVSDKTQALASVLALIFGTAAAVGGAIAAIQIASLGLKITQRQEDIQRTGSGSV